MPLPLSKIMAFKCEILLPSLPPTPFSLRLMHGRRVEGANLHVPPVHPAHIEKRTVLYLVVHSFRWCQRIEAALWPKFMKLCAKFIKAKISHLLITNSFDQYFFLFMCLGQKLTLPVVPVPVICSGSAGRWFRCHTINSSILDYTTHNIGSRSLRTDSSSSCFRMAN